jgi:CHASE2 domain-containing sensor protein
MGLKLLALMVGLCLIEFQASYFPVALRNLVTDLLMSMVPEVEAKTVLVTIDDKDVERFGQCLGRGTLWAAQSTFWGRLVLVPLV